MKKNRILISLSFILLLIISGCEYKNNSFEEGYEQNSILTPYNKLDIAGVWKNTGVYELGDNKKTEGTSEDMFISRKVFEFNDTFTIEPNISSRFVDYFSYMRPKISEIPKDLITEKTTAKIFKISDDISFTQELIQLEENKFITIHLGKIYIYEKQSEVNDKIIDEKYNKAMAANEGRENIKNNSFGLAISFRVRNTSSEEKINYNYYTYYIKQSEKDEKPLILKVNNIVSPLTSGLWTIKSEENRNDDNKEYTLSASPTFSDETDITNAITDDIYRRIDYVNDNYIAVTNYDYSSTSVSESYNIFEISKLFNKHPLNATNIAGNSGNEIYLTSYKENINLIQSQEDLDLLKFEPDPTNIGIRRTNNNWRFISNIDEQLDDDKGSRVYKRFDLNITPTVDIARINSNMFSWREILSRRPGAIDATVSLDKNYILIQNNNSIDLFPVYFNYIGNNPLFSIQNVNNYEIVMINWVTQENIDIIYDEYIRLPRLNSYIIYP